MFARRFWRLSGSIRGRALDLAGRGSLLFSSSQKKIKGFNTEDTERGTEGHGDSTHRRFVVPLWDAVLSVASVLKPPSLVAGRRLRGVRCHTRYPSGLTCTAYPHKIISAVLKLGES
jgi:hypothetical protein